MNTWTAFTTLASESNAQRLGAALEGLDPEPIGVGVFELEDGSGMWEVGGYFTDRPDDIGLTLAAVAHGAPEFTVSKLPERDWVAHVRRELAPVEAGRFFVYGAHDAERVPPDRIALRIEAAMAFGTGHHGTTLGCLRALDRLIEQGRTFQHIADIGCGTAVLAMAAARVWPDRTVLASDIDPVAVDVARANVEANDLADRVQCIEATGFDHPDLAQPGRFDLIFANILKGPLLELAAPMAKSLDHGGCAILSGILNEQADEVVEKYAEYGFNTLHNERIVDWTSLTLVKNREI